MIKELPSPVGRDPKGKDEDLKDSLDLFDVDKNNIDLDKEFQYEVMIPKETADSILRISRSVKVEVLKLSGYEEVQTDNKNAVLFRIKKDPLCSSGVIKVFDTLLSAHADESQIAGKRDWDEFAILARASWRSFHRYCLREKSSPDINLRSVYRVFQDLLLNIGEIVCGNKGSLDKLLGAIKYEHNDNEVMRVR